VADEHAVRQAGLLLRALGVSADLRRPQQRQV
jgi:hypothetical protein